MRFVWCGLIGFGYDKLRLDLLCLAAHTKVIGSLDLSVKLELLETNSPSYNP